MARFAKRTPEENTPAVEATEEEILLPGEAPTEETASENADWQAQLASAFDAPAEENGSADNDETPEDTAMPETTTPENAPAENAESLLSEEMQRVANGGTTAVVMRSIEELPKDAKIVRMQLTILEELAEEYTDLKQELTDGTSGKDDKIAAFLTDNEEILDENGTDLKNALAEAQEARDKAIAAANAAEAALMAHVEDVLAKSGKGVLSEEAIKAKTEEIKSKYSEYVGQYKAAKEFLDNYRNSKNPDAGEIHQYVTHIDRPSGRATSTSGGNASRNTSGVAAARSVHVSGAFFSPDNGATWIQATKDVQTPKGITTLSNPAELAVLMGSHYKTVVSKDDIVDAWYSASGRTRDGVGGEMATKANMPNEKIFDMTIKNGDGENVTVPVKLLKRQ